MFSPGIASLPNQLLFAPQFRPYNACPGILTLTYSISNTPRTSSPYQSISTSSCLTRRMLTMEKRGTAS